MKALIISVLFFFACLFSAKAQDDQTMMKNNINELKSEVSALRKSDRALQSKLTKTSDDLSKQISSEKTMLTEQDIRIANNADSLKSLKAETLAIKSETDTMVNKLENKSMWNRIFLSVFFLLALGFASVAVLLYLRRIKALKVDSEAKLAQLEQKMNVENNALKVKINDQNNNLLTVLNKQHEEVEKEIRHLREFHE